MGNNNNGGGGGSSGMMILLIGGVCCVCCVCMGGLGLLYATNKDFRNMFSGGGGGVSADAGRWVCPDLDNKDDKPWEKTYQEMGPGKEARVWCEAKGKRRSTAASKLPVNAIKGKKYNRETLLTADGGGGIYGPAAVARSYGEDLPVGVLLYTAG